MSSEAKTEGEGKTRRQASQETRLALMKALAANGQSMLWLSRQLGKNTSYIQQFIERGSPADLDLTTKIKVADLLGISIADLGVTDLDIRLGRPCPSEDEAVVYDPPVGSILNREGGISYWRALTKSLNLHPMRIEPGDILAFDFSSELVAQLKTEAVVLVECKKHSLLPGRMILREFVRPGLLTTNSSERNECFQLGEPGMPFAARCVAVCRSVIRSSVDLG